MSVLIVGGKEMWFSHTSFLSYIDKYSEVIL
jgi:hypothetical protein